jgi:hypothetical protein
VSTETSSNPEPTRPTDPAATTRDEKCIPTLEEILRELDMEKYLVPDDDLESPAAFGGLQGGNSK